MRFVTQLVFSLKVLRQRQSVWVGMLAIGLWGGTAWGQTFPNLHDGNDVYGIDARLYATPWTNSTIINLLGLGEINSSLYTNVNFSIYGISTGAALTNQAAIDVNGIGGNAYSDGSPTYAIVDSHGIYGFLNRGAEIANSGNITVAARGGNAQADGFAAQAYAVAYGISTDEIITNTGAINVFAWGGTAIASNNTSADAQGVAYGLYTSANIINDGPITVSATGGTALSSGATPSAHAHASAFGLYADEGVENTAELTVLATGGTADGTTNTTASASAQGIHSYSGDVINSGDLVVTALGGTVLSGGIAAATAYGIVNNGNVYNSGDITVTAQTFGPLVSSAYGIYLGGDVSDLTNTGTIRVFADSPYELYVGYGTTRIVNTYNVTLDGDPAQASIFVGDDATLNLNNALLTVTDVPSGQGATQLGVEYQLFEVAANGSVTGNFSSVAAVNPDLTAHYYTLGTPSAADDRVSLSYQPQHAETLASTTVQRRMVGMAPYAINQHMTSDLMYDMLAPDELDDPTEDDAAGDTTQGLTACQRSGGAFLQPHYSYIKRDNDPLGYNAGMTGVSGGYSQCVNSSLLGLHVGYGKANIDYTGAGYSANTEDQGVVTSGFSGMTRWRPWLLRYGFSGFRGWHDYRGLTGLGLTESESASYDSYGGTGLVMVGRTFKHKKHVFLPEVGANWLWIHRESYTTEATDPAWDTTYSTLNEHDIWAQAALHWQSLYRYKKLQITPSASVALHQLLTDGESEIWQSIPGAARVQVQDEMDETAVALATSVVIRSRRTALTFAYDGEYSSDIEQHNFWMKFRLRF
ncbi:MAG: hypothetical protein KBI32_07060, partial [Phycisphaerae bacterium]|nr:hypothetical protein [Phycisphaerae bacterium]HON91194.1 hypothetical protein [Sedimentisphaerales bacterium]